MTTYIVAFVFLIGLFLFMALALQFSKYKKRPSGCYGGNHCAMPEKEDENVKLCC